MSAHVEDGAHLLVCDRCGKTLDVVTDADENVGWTFAEDGDDYCRDCSSEVRRYRAER
jgi:hypothetical protein